MDTWNQFVIKPGRKVRLKDFDPEGDPEIDKEKGEKELEKLRRELNQLQWKLYDENKQALLIVLQALDAGGKDGVVKHVCGAFNAAVANVVAFKKPSAEAMDRDYLWRVHAAVPSKGEIVVFNRSHYEDVLITRVHDLVPKKKLDQRYSQLNMFESFLTENGTHILKFFLHISPEEQLRRFADRLGAPEKQWKIADSDYTERVHWDAYTEAYEAVLSKCSTKTAPWFVIPSDRKWFRNLVIARILVGYLKKVKFAAPEPTVDLEWARAEYEKAVNG